MKFKIDENLPKQSVELIRKKGYDSVTVSEEELTGIEDEKLIKICTKEQRCLVTADLDFANVISYPPEEYYGIVVMRPPKMTKKILLTLIDRFIEFLDKNEVKGKLLIIEINKIRIHDDKK